MIKILYVSSDSVWSAAAELAVAELGYKDGDIIFKIVNLAEGENFEPSFLKISPNGTIPAFTSNGKAYTSTAEITAALVQEAPIKVKAGSTIIETIHADKYDPNFALLLARNDAELTAKGSGRLGMFVSRRQETLEKVSQDPEAVAFKAYYEIKKEQNGILHAMYKDKVPPKNKADFFAQSQAHYDNVKGAVFELLPSFLPDSGFIGGEIPGEDDFHVGAWLTRIVTTTGGTSADDGLAAVEAEYGTPVPEKVAAYWRAWTARPSWKKVYTYALR